MNAIQSTHPGHALWATARWQVVPATLSVALGTILFVLNCIHLHNAMLPEIGRAFDPKTNFTISHGIMCMIASTLFFAASACAFAAARKWMMSEYQAAIMLNASTPLLIAFGVFLAYMQI